MSDTCHRCGQQSSYMAADAGTGYTRRYCASCALKSLQSFQIFFRSLDGKTHVMNNVHGQDAAAMLIERIMAKLEMSGDAGEYRLLCEGKQLEPELPCKLTAGQTVHLLPRLRGGMRAHGAPLHLTTDVCTRMTSKLKHSERQGHLRDLRVILQEIKEAKVVAMQAAARTCA